MSHILYYGAVIMIKIKKDWAKLMKNIYKFQKYYFLNKIKLKMNIFIFML